MDTDISAIKNKMREVLEKLPNVTQMKKELSAKKYPSYRNCIEGLFNYLVILDFLIEVRKIPEISDIQSDIPISIENRDKWEGLVEKVFKELDKHVEIDPWMSLEHYFMQEGEGPVTIHVPPYGLIADQDEIYAIWENEINEYSENFDSLFVFLGLLVGFGNLDNWVFWENHYQWNINLFPLTEVGDYNIDWNKFRQSLSEAGLNHFVAAIHMAAQDTQTIYLDCNPYDDGFYPEDWGILDFTAENIQRLRSEWNSASSILDLYAAAQEQFQQEPSIAEEIIRIWNASCEIRS